MTHLCGLYVRVVQRQNGPKPKRLDATARGQGQQPGPAARSNRQALSRAIRLPFAQHPYIPGGATRCRWPIIYSPPTVARTELGVHANLMADVFEKNNNSGVVFGGVGTAETQDKGEMAQEVGYADI